MRSVGEVMGVEMALGRFVVWWVVWLIDGRERRSGG